MTKTELIQKIYDSTDNVYKRDIDTIVNTLLTTIVDTLESHETVDIGGFGKFEVKERSERQGINPATGEKITIPASQVVKFKPAKALKDKVNHN